MKKRQKVLTFALVSFGVLGFAVGSWIGFNRAGVAEKAGSLPVGPLSGRVLVGTGSGDSACVLEAPLGVCAADEMGAVYVADYKANRIAVFDKNGRLTRTIGRAGQGPGELLNPVDVAVAAGKLYVLEAGNFRVSIFDLRGNYVGGFRVGPLSADQGIAVSRDGRRIYLNEPTPMSGHLFTVYDEQGQVVQRFGQLIEPERGTQKFEMNTVCFGLGREDQLYAFFKYRPAVRRYSWDGKLLFSGKLRIPEVPQKLQDQRQLLKEHPEGALVTFVADVSVRPDGRLFIVVPPSRSLLRKLRGPTAVVYELDASLRPLQRLFWRVPEPLRQSYFDGFCVSTPGAGFGTMRWAGALVALALQPAEAGLVDGWE